MRMLIPFFVWKNFYPRISTKFGWRLIPMWPFSETNAAAMRASPPVCADGLSWTEPLRGSAVL
jgi:hypothetical protein